MGTRENLLKAASDLLMEVGFEGMTTAQIAKRAGVAEGTIYRHFSSKEALVEAVFHHGWSFLNDYMEAHLPPRSEPQARLDAIFPVTLEALRTPEMKECHGLAQAEHLYYASKKTDPFALPDGLRHYVERFAETIHLAQEAGAVRRTLDPQLTALFLFAGASTVLDTYADPHDQGRPSAYPREQVFAQIDGFARHILYGDAR